MPRLLDDKLREAIRGIVDVETQQTMPLSCREIANQARRILGYKPSTSTVAIILRELGLDTQAGHSRWAYKHNKQKPLDIDID